MKEPLVTIIMPVYNAAHYLREAIDSILKQTYKNFEFIIIDDASCDNSVEIIKSYSDNRIKLIRNKVNLKQPITRNKGLKLASGRYIANMDADDISLPERIAKQVDFMEKHQDVDICGTYIKCFGGKIKRVPVSPVKSREIAVWSVIDSPLAHPTVMFRASSIKKYDVWYDSNFKYAQDFELWSRLVLKGVNFYNLAEVLLYYREGKDGISRKYKREQQRLAGIIINRNMKNIFAVTNDINSVIDYDCGFETVKRDIEFLSMCRKKLPLSELFTDKELDDVLVCCIKKIVMLRTYYGLGVFYQALRAIEFHEKDKIWWGKLLIKCLIRAC